ncbi:MAG TPA: MOSC N-terminal beta barrel domain-containing protein [Terriglobia bacterium]|nr:MOSC N-terminal beta barrel domain-containing protein [Terriglobia bacterium]
MWVQEIWRYPVKSMAGESLGSADLTEQGITGDRILQVWNSAGRIVTARTRPALLGHRATLGPDGEPKVDGRVWSSAEVAREVEVAAGKGTRLARSESEDRFDVLPLLMVTDGMLAAVGYDRRRFRPNLVIGGVAGLSEREWEGGTLLIGAAVIGVEELRTRCIMTTYDPDTQVQDLEVLRRVQKEFAGRLGLNCYVLAPGHIRVGDSVEFVRSR